MAEDVYSGMNSRDFDVSEHGSMIELIGMLLRGEKQFAATPLPESTTDNRHLGWRISWPKG